MILKLFLFSILAFHISYAQIEHKVESEVIAATVFKDRALITREATLDFQKGEHTILFSNLTTDLQDQSVRIFATGPGIIKILDVKVERKFTTEIRQDKIKTLQSKIDSLKNHLQIATDQIAIYESKKEFIESLKAKSVNYINQKMLTSTTSTKDWSKMLLFVDKNLTEIYEKLRQENQSRQKLELQIKTLQMTINQSRGGKSSNYKEIIAKIETSEKGRITINPSYIVQDVNWYPLYDIRVLSKSKEVEFSYFGMVQQSTGEDWKDIKLTFSTADPLSIKSLPKLENWYLNSKPLSRKHRPTKVRGTTTPEYQLNYDQNWGIPQGQGSISGYVIDENTSEPLPGVNIILKGTFWGSSTDINGKFLISNIPAGYYSLGVNYIGYENIEIKLRVVEKHTSNLMIMVQQSILDINETIEVNADRPLMSRDNTSSKVLYMADGVQVPKYTNVYAKELSTIFEIQTKYSIPSDNSKHKVTIAIEKLPIEFQYTSIPKIIQKVYLKGKIVNTKDYPLLEGELNVFVDNDFINRTYLNTIVPTDTLEIALGVDESIQSEKILINKFQESKGLLGGSKQITYDYEIRIKNNRLTEEVIWVYDQLPIAMNENIQVELLSPKKEINELNNDLRLIWRLVLKPGENRTLPIKFQVKFPDNLSVYGLE